MVFEVSVVVVVFVIGGGVLLGVTVDCFCFLSDHYVLDILRMFGLCWWFLLSSASLSFASLCFPLFFVVQVLSRKLV